jgi:L-cysteine:1D-myo-inositol 2-amino-2-deoxy-alpha-D-glucopyranoside ligase
MRLFDTRTRERVEVGAGPTVGLYVCGITPYDSAHLGHAFVYTVFDALVRYLEHQGRRVRYARNVTDVDDDILRKAAELDTDYLELGRREVARFDRDLDGLGLRRPDVVPLATETVPAIVDAVRTLIERGNAYALPDGRVYFDVATAPAFGALSRLTQERMLAQFAEKGGDPDAPGKRQRLDFLLWQPSAGGEPGWPGPVDGLGPGRPGWHIECSVMALRELGPVVGVHGGGDDLIFPHHEAEIVQSEHLTGRAPFARIWMHAGLVSLGGTKMSKSLGNLVFLSDLLERYEGAAVRRYLLSHHYREGWEFDDAALADAAVGLKRWRGAAGAEGQRPDLELAFHQALADDLDTPGALAALDEAAAAGAGGTVRTLADVLGFALPG